MPFFTRSMLCRNAKNSMGLSLHSCKSVTLSLSLIEPTGNTRKGGGFLVPITDHK